MRDLTCIYLPKREELSFRVVFALPNASRMGLVARICFSISLDSSKENFDFDFEFESGGFTEARYRIMNFAYIGVNQPRSQRSENILTDSVFPAPL